MSYFDDASLVMIPSGYKDQKVYSVKPIDGSGDLTFSRASNATRVNSSGLVEKVRENLVLQSNTFDTTWTTTNATLTSGQSGYDGSSDAWLLNKSGTQGRLTQSITQSDLQTLSIYAKKGTSEYLRMFVNGPNSSIYFNLNDGTIQSSSAIVSGKSTDVGGGWYRLEVAFTGSTTAVNYYPAEAGSTAGTSGTVYIQDAQLETGDIATDYIATTSSAVSVGPVSGLPRLDYSGGASCPSLLLEPSATALNQYSEQLDNAYWIKNDVTVEANTTDTLDPSGYYGADKIVETATPARHRVAAGGTTTSATNHTASVFMKKGTARYGFVTFSGAAVSTIVVDLEDGTITSTSTSGTIVAQKVESYSNGWYRISVTALGIATTTTYTLQFGSAGSATPSYTSNIPAFTGSTSNYLYAWGANITNTSYLQSYIPTLSTAVTRVAESCSKTGISSLIGQTEGTMFFEFEDSDYSFASIARAFAISDGTYDNRIYLAQLSSGAIYCIAAVGGSSTMEIQEAAPSGRRGTIKAALAYKNNDFVLYVNGTNAGTDTSSAVPACSNLYLGQEIGLTANSLNKPYKQALLFKTRLSNADLATLTA